MTIREVIDHVDRVKPNAFSDEDKVIWLNELEYAVQTDIWGLTEGFRKHTLRNEWRGDYASVSELGELVIPEELYMLPGGKIWFEANGTEYILGDTLRYSSIRDGSTAVMPAGGPMSTLIEEFTGTLSFSYDGCTAEMFAPEPYQKIYYTYLEARIDAAQGEWKEYDNTMQLFNGFLGEYQRWWARHYIDNEELRT